MKNLTKFLEDFKTEEGMSIIKMILRDNDDTRSKKVEDAYNYCINNIDACKRGRGYVAYDDLDECLNDLVYDFATSEYTHQEICNANNEALARQKSLLNY